MSFKSWLTGKKDRNSDRDKYFKAIRLTLEVYGVQVAAKESESELDRLLDQIMAMYGATKVIRTLNSYKKKFGLDYD